MAPHSVSRIDRKSSIETEPRTLDMQQIQFAREAAMYVINTRGIEEAFGIFTKGMEPVVSMGGQDRSVITSMTENQDDEHNDYSLKKNQEFGVGQLRDVLTAPF